MYMRHVQNIFRTICALLVSGVLIYSAHAQNTPTSSQGATCGKDTMTFGCHAYIYGNTGSATSYAGRADSVFVDAQYMSQNPGVAQRLNQTGPVPLFYVNAYCERRFGGCSGPQLSGSSVAAQYGEYAQHPNSAEFYSNFNRQLEWVKRSQGKVIEIDNMDFYIEKGHKAAIIKLIQLAANAGINVLSKNVRDTEILRQPNVVGAVVEAGSGNALDYHSVFASVGKQCAGVLMINAKNKTGNNYTSFTECDHPSRGDKSEYTKCTCKKNPAGMQIAGTPVAGPNVDIPPSQPAQQYNPLAPQSYPFSQSQQGLTQPTGVQGSPTSSAPIQQPLAQYPPQMQQPQLAQLPGSPTEKPTGVKDGQTEKNKTDQTKSLETLKEKNKEDSLSTQTEETSLIDPLGSSKKTTSGTAAKGKQVLVPRPFGNVRLRCVPQAIYAGARPTLAWSCPREATSSKGISFTTDNYLLGSTRVAPKQTTLFAVNCYEEGVLIGSAQCVIKVQVDKSSAESFDTAQKVQDEPTRKKNLCFLSFCL